MWSFNVIASDEAGAKGSMDSTAVVNVRLVDINDNAPVFDKPPYVGHIMENAAPGSLVMHVAANDYDDPLMGHNAVLRYQIAENKKFGSVDVFSINETSGQIYQNLALDREQIDKYTIEVCATDGSGKRGCGQLTIYVEDANDQAPQFQAQHYTETIGEDWPIGERVLAVTATDKDIGANAELSYALVAECLVRTGVYTGNDEHDCVEDTIPDSSGSQNKQQQHQQRQAPKHFKVDTEREANSGFVKLAKAVNYDPPDYHRLFKLNVSVSDGLALNYTTVFVHIADVNDEAPRFLEPVKNVAVLESIAPMTLITNFSAVDLDTNEANRRFTYSLDRKSEGAHEFTIDQHGNLFNLEALDRELKDKYILRIVATDEGQPPQSGIATLNLDVLDVNDNFPTFADAYRPVVMENAPAGQLVCEVRAKDADEPRNGPPFTFELLSDSASTPPRFNMSTVRDPFSGETRALIYSLVRMDREAAKEYRLPVLIADSGQPPMSGISYLTVTVGDLNDNAHAPGVKRILVYDYKGSVTRSAASSTFIGTVFADDQDDWDMHDKEFRMLDEAAADTAGGDTLGAGGGANAAAYVRSYFEIVESAAAAVTDKTR